MKEALAAFDARMEPFEKVFFTWITRIIMAGVFIGTSWIDDAPPLELAAFVFTAYVGIRILSQISVMHSAIPLKNAVLSGFFTLVALLVVLMSFFTITTFSFALSEMAVG